MSKFNVVFTIVVWLAVIALAVHLQRQPHARELPEFATPHNVTFKDTLTFPRGEHELWGVVLDADGSSAEGVLVQLRAGPEPRGDFTLADGSFAIHELPAGVHEVVLVAPEHLPVTVEVELPLEEPVVFHLPPRRAPLESLPLIERRELTGRLLPSPAALSNDLRDYEVVLRPLPGADPLEGGVVRRVPAAPDGRFAVPDLVDVPYVLEVLPPWARGGSWPVLARRDVERGGSSELEIRLESAEIRGVVRDPTGARLEGALVRVTAESDENRIWPAGTTDAEGRYVVPDLPAGRYYLRLRAGARGAEALIDLEAGEIHEPVIEYLNEER